MKNILLNEILKINTGNRKLVCKYLQVAMGPKSNLTPLKLTKEQFLRYLITILSKGNKTVNQIRKQ